MKQPNIEQLLLWIPSLPRNILDVSLFGMLSAGSFAFYGLIKINFLINRERVDIEYLFLTIENHFFFSFELKFLIEKNYIEIEN